MFQWLSVSQMFQQASGPARTSPVFAPPGASSPPYYLAAPTAPEQPDQPAMSWQTAGLVMSIAGAGTAAIGALASVRSEQNAAKSQALSLEFEQSMSAINARNAEIEAQSLEQSGRRQADAANLQAAAEKSSFRARTGGSGVQVGRGSAAAVEASIEYVRQADVMAIGVNTARSVAAARTNAVNAQNRGLLAGVSARNARRSAGNDLTAFSALNTSLLTSGSSVLGNLATDRRRGVTW